MSALRVITVRHGTIRNYQYFGFLTSDCRSESIIDLLTNVLIVSAMLPSASHKCGCTKKPALNTSLASNTGRGSDVIVLIEAGGFYSRK